MKKIESVQRRAACTTLNRYRRTSSVGAMLTELNCQLLAERRRIAYLVMFYRIHYHLVAITNTMPLESKMSSSPLRTENSLFPWLTSFQPHTVIIVCTHSSQELFMNGISCHNLLFYFVLLSHSGVHCHLSDLDPGTLCSAWESRPIQEEPKVHFYFNRLHRH